MKYIKIFENNTIHPYFSEVLECVKNSYERNLSELYSEIDEMGDDLDEWGEFIYQCLNEDDIKDFGEVFIDKYIGGDGIIDLVHYLREQLNVI